MEDLTGWTDDRVFGGAGEQPGSQMSYWRDIEIKRRQNLLEKDLLSAQIEAVAAQRAATAEARKQSAFLLASTIAAAISAIAALATTIIALYPRK